jgi:hypothetical protein
MKSMFGRHPRFLVEGGIFIEDDAELEEIQNPDAAEPDPERV